MGCATEDQNYIITSPTALHIPNPVLGTTEVALMPDGHFGAADPIHHPQLLVEDCRFPWMAAICSPDFAHLAGGHLWEPLSRGNDFVHLKSSNVGLGTASPERVKLMSEPFDNVSHVVHAFEAQYGRNNELRWMFDTLIDAIDRLSFPSTFRDLARTWACVQRFWLYTHAWADWYMGFTNMYPVENFRCYCPRNKWMGCFTTSLILASRLAKANVPVWLIRSADQFSGSETIAACVAFTEPVESLRFADRVHQEEMQAEFTGAVRKRLLAGDQHLCWINREATRYLDKEALPITLPSRLNTLGVSGSASSDVATTKATSSTSKFTERYHPCKNLRIDT